MFTVQKKKKNPTTFFFRLLSCLNAHQPTANCVACMLCDKFCTSYIFAKNFQTIEFSPTTRRLDESLWSPSSFVCFCTIVYFKFQIGWSFVWKYKISVQVTQKRYHYYYHSIASKIHIVIQCTAKNIVFVNNFDVFYSPSPQGHSMQTMKEKKTHQEFYRRRRKIMIKFNVWPYVQFEILRKANILWNWNSIRCRSWRCPNWKHQKIDEDDSRK